MKIHISINCDNAAFGESAYECGEELRRILYHLGDELATNGPLEAPSTLFDGNGNRVGNVVIEK